MNTILGFALDFLQICFKRSHDLSRWEHLTESIGTSSGRSRKRRKSWKSRGTCYSPRMLRPPLRASACVLVVHGTVYCVQRLPSDLYCGADCRASLRSCFRQMDKLEQMQVLYWGGDWGGGLRMVQKKFAVLWLFSRMASLDQFYISLKTNTQS